MCLHELSFNNQGVWAHRDREYSPCAFEMKVLDVVVTHTSHNYI